jgi:hypothetical protein
MAFNKLYSQPVWFKISCHLNLINIAGHNPANGGELLRRAAIWI